MTRRSTWAVKGPFGWEGVERDLLEAELAETHAGNERRATAATAPRATTELQVRAEMERAIERRLARRWVSP